MVFLPKDLVMSAEEAANVIKVAETDPYNEDWTPAFDARESVLLKTNEKFTDWYDLYENLGEGKFGKVYRCVEKSTKLELAAKCIRLKRDADKKQVEKEVSFMTRMHHRHIAQIYDAFATSNNEVVLIMEIVHGGELFDRVVEENYILTETAVAMIVYQICEAIRYIHSHNIIHLDLKPENIMCLSQTGNQIKLIDFGLAQYYDGEHDLLFMAGTPEFAAPEVIKFEPLDFHTDMWSVGVIVYILLSGESPFLGDNLALTYFNVERGLWEFCEEFDDNGVSQEAKDFIVKLLILDKSKRMLPVDCLNHPWIVNHREKARQIALDNKEDDSTKINKAKLRTYVRNKNFRRLVFGVLFVNTIVRIFNTLKEKNSESGIQYVKTMLNAVNKENEAGEGSSSLIQAAMMAKRKRNIENEPGPSTVLSNEELSSKTQRLDSGLGEGSTKVSATEDEEITIIEPISNNSLISISVKTSREPSPINEVLGFPKRSRASSKSSDKSANEGTTPKKIKKKKVSSKVSQDSALSPLINAPVIKEAVQEEPQSLQSEAQDQMGELRDTKIPSLDVTTTTTTTTTASEDESVPKKKIIRRKKAPKPVLTLRDVEVPVVKYAGETKKTVKKKKKSSDNILDVPAKNVEMAPIQALIARRRSSAEKRGGLVGNMLAKLEQIHEQKSTAPMKFAISGIAPRKVPQGLPKPPLWNAACDVLKINGQNAKIEKISNGNADAGTNPKVEIPIKLEKKTVSERKVSIKKKALKMESSMAEDNLRQSEKSNLSKCEVAFESTTNIQEGDQKISNASKVLFAKELNSKEKERSEISPAEVKRILAEKSVDASEKVGFSELKTQNGKKVSDCQIKLKGDEESKAIASGKIDNKVETGAVILQQKKSQKVEVVQDGFKTSTKVQTKQKIVAGTKSPKASSDSKPKKKTSVKAPKNRSLDDLLEEKVYESPLTKATVSNDKLNSKEPKPRNESFSIMHTTKAAGSVGKVNVQHERHMLLEKKNSAPVYTGDRKRSLLDPEEIEELQARERDAFNFNSLKNLLEQRVSGNPPINEFEEWRRQKTEEVRSSLRDSANVKRAMRKWISLDRKNQ
ncbi:hypothetical protein FO519_001902 [Halicephalobus sp. NKZ332]|nr:hypothetical protein FO519_001902 [Halicephalobus sp. NKZ332]